jgi:hypothetical protein
VLIFWVSPGFDRCEHLIDGHDLYQGADLMGAYQTGSAVVLIVVVFFIGQITVYCSLAHCSAGDGCGILGYHSVIEDCSHSFSRQKLKRIR